MLAAGKFIAKVIKDSLKNIFNSVSIPSRLQKKSVLIFQENSNIRVERRMRAQPFFFVDNNAHLNKPLITLIETCCFGTKASQADIMKLEGDGIGVIGVKFVAPVDLKKELSKEQYCNITKFNNLILKNIFFKFSKRYEEYIGAHLYELLILQLQMAKLLIYLNVMAFINREPQFLYADAIQLVSQFLNVKTFSYQYSNLSSPSPLMMSTADTFFGFSDLYLPIFSSNGIAPSRFLSNGYIYDSVFKDLKIYSQGLRDRLFQHGAKFVLTYFDESVDDSNYGMIKKEQLLEDLTPLFEMVLSDNSFGLITKSQYIRNSPKNLFPNNRLVMEVLKTGRYIDLIEGVHRNELYPAEAAMASDFCINHKFGGTAALESALCGSRVLILNRYKIYGVQDEIYDGKNIVFDNIEDLLRSIKEYRLGNPKLNKLGCWEEILFNFDPFRDGGASKRMWDFILSEMNDGKLNSFPP